MRRYSYFSYPGKTRNRFQVQDEMNAGEVAAVIGQTYSPRRGDSLRTAAPSPSWWGRERG